MLIASERADYPGNMGLYAKSDWLRLAGLLEKYL